MKAHIRKTKTQENISLLTIQPFGMEFPTTIPVITKGSRDKTGAWTWNGSLDKPTVRPSVRTKYFNKEGKKVELHYWLNDGICKCLSDCTDGNAGKELELSNINEAFLPTE